MAIMDSLNEKYGPLPLWSWGLVTALGAGAYLIHKKNTASSANAQSTQAAADQTNTDLGSASELANMFEVAGEMPYQGGDTYINISQPAGSSGTGTTGTTTTGTTGIRSGTPASPAGGTVATPPMPPKTTTGSTPASNVKSYTVKSGDTMEGIASKQFGLPATEAGADTLYNYDGNAATVRTNAQKHGITSDFVHWIYPGEQLKYPVKS
jgi:hypothetical protein